MAKTAAELERESISVDVAKLPVEGEQENSETVTETAEGEETEAETAEATEGEEAEVEVGETNLDDKDKKILKLEKTLERLQKRIGKTTGERAEIANKLKEAETALTAARTSEGGLDEAEVERRSDAKAERKVIEREYANTCNRLFDEGVKVDKNFKAKIDAMAEDIGTIPMHMIISIGELDNGGAVLHYLAENVDEAEALYALSPAKMTVKLAKLDAKIETEKKKSTNKTVISKVPNPMEQIGGNRSSTTVLTGKETMDEFVRKRNQMDAEKIERQKRGYS